MHDWLIGIGGSLAMGALVIGSAHLIHAICLVLGV